METKAAAQPILSEQTYSDLVGLKLKPGEIGRFENFLEPFSDVGRKYICRLMLGCLRAKKPFDQIILKLEDTWRERWSKGTPGRIGDPDDITPPGVGAMNVGGIVLVYKSLQVPFGTL
jgi:hypothetical protein